MVGMRLRGEHVTGLNVDEVRTEAAPSADGPAELPRLSIHTIAGLTLDAQSLEGKVVVVEMWATWCPPCLSTMKWLNTLEERYGDRVEVIAIAVDSPAEAVQKLAADLKPNYRILQGTPEVIARFGEIAAVPKLFIFDREGKRAQTFYGAPPDLHEKIATAVGTLLR